MHGFYRVAAATPVLALADPLANRDATLHLAARAADERCAVTVFPELGLTGYTCGDLFFQDALRRDVATALGDLVTASQAWRQVLVVGAPLAHRGRLYNCAVVVQAGRVLGVVPKTCLPNYKEFYEHRWFRSGGDVRGDSLTVAGQQAPFGIDLLFGDGDDFVLGVELCEDLWNVIPPSSYQALAGATVIANASASNDMVAKAAYRRELVRGQSARCLAAYVYSSAGPGESTQDLVYGGHTMIAENGSLLAEGQRFPTTPQLLTAEVDVQRLRQTRLLEACYADNPVPPFRRVALAAPLPEPEALRRHYDPTPFVPDDARLRDERCREIFSIQATALARRLAHIGPDCRPVLGISGGLDSTLALLVVHEALARLERAPDQALAVTMPGFGTTDRTRGNARKLADELGSELREISIAAACEQHFRDLGHDPRVHDTTYENVQARERTQILMDLANQVGGIVVGTGDLSELALGWATYNGDHMSMYAVNTSVPKTLIRYLVAWVADHAAPAARETLHDILDTPISPELLPADERGQIAQRTEDLIGPYELHDFFLYHALKYGAPPDKLRYLANHAFAGRYDSDTIENWLRVFIKRFFAQQFKRSCLPDGPKVGTISLSPRGDWRMPPDAHRQAWLAALD